MSKEYTPTNTYTTCPVCDSKEISVFFDLLNIPACGFIWNLVFDPTRLNYTQTYKNSLFYSPLFQEYTNALVQRLINRYDMRNKNVIDIGCGKGDFLFLLCKLGNNRGVGFDTSYENIGDDGGAPNGVMIIQDYYSEKYAEYKGDLICSRFVLEHIEHPKTFLQMLRNTIGDRRHVIVFFEVPNTSLILRDLSVWDIIYEHCSYFSPNSLERVFTLSGFSVADLYDSYKGQFLCIEALPTNGQIRPNRWSEDNLQEMTKEVDSFVDNNHKQLESWQMNLEQLEAGGKKAVLWGAGARGASFLNMLKIKDSIRYVVDINPHKYGKYIPGTGQQIVPPEFLRNYDPDFLILTNVIYEKEILKTVKSLGINPEFMQ
ncbi:MAG: class I SAM-dependent methyltransferase [Planctomycetota bacterium]|jgi:SAM-dependent methyltransferase